MIKTERNSWSDLISATISLHISAFFIVPLFSTYCQYLSVLLQSEEKNQFDKNYKKQSFSTISYCVNIFPLLGTIKENPYTEYR